MRETLSSEISPHTIATAQWWQDRASAFKGLNHSLCLDLVIEEEDGVEVRRYWRIHGADDPNRANYKDWVTEIGLEQNLPQGVEPFQHFCYELRKDQEENNEDYRRQPAGNEVVSTTKVRTGGEVSKEDRAGLAKWSKALLAAEVIINEAALKNIQRRKKVKAQRARINKEERRNKRRIAEKTVFDKAIEISPKYKVPKRIILGIKKANYVLKTTRAICMIPNPGAAAGAFLTRLGEDARLKAKRVTVKKQAAPRPPRMKIEPILDLDRLRNMKSLSQKQAGAELGGFLTAELGICLPRGSSQRLAKVG